MKKSSEVFLTYTCVPPLASACIFPGCGAKTTKKQKKNKKKKRLLTMQRKLTYTKRFALPAPQRKCPVLRQQLQTVVSPRKFYTEQMFVSVSMNNLIPLRVSWQSSKRITNLVNYWSKYKSYQNTVRTRYTHNSNKFPLFQCFHNVLECCKCARVRFHCPNGLVVPRIYVT